MSYHTLTLDIPEQLYARLAERASQSQRSVADEALAAMAQTIPTEDVLDSALTRTLQGLETLDDTQLRQAAVRTLSQRDDRRLRALARRNSAGEITAAETDELTTLLDRLEDIGLVRAKATALLRARTQHQQPTLMGRALR